MKNPVNFNHIPWISTAKGVKEKIIQEGGRSFRLVRFYPEFEEEGWCTKGHLGVVLKGEFTLNYPDGKIVFKQGDIINLIEGEEDKHAIKVPEATVAEILLFE